MLNPSKARHDIDDPTIRKCTGFAKRMNAGGFLVVNLFAYSATDPRSLIKAKQDGVDVRGPHNETAIEWASRLLSRLGYTIAAWGRIPPPLRSAAQRSEKLFVQARGSVDCLGTTKEGFPRHPLMLPYETPVVRLLTSV